MPILQVEKVIELRDLQTLPSFQSLGACPGNVPNLCWGKNQACFPPRTLVSLGRRPEYSDGEGWRAQRGVESVWVALQNVIPTV